MKTNNLWPSNFVCFFLMLKENKNIFVDPKASWAWGTVTSVHQWSQPWVPGSLTAHLPLCLLKMPTWFAPQNLCPGSAPENEALWLDPGLRTSDETPSFTSALSWTCVSNSSSLPLANILCPLSFRVLITHWQLWFILKIIYCFPFSRRDRILGGGRQWIAIKQQCLVASVPKGTKDLLWKFLTRIKAQLELASYSLPWYYSQSKLLLFSCQFSFKFKRSSLVTVPFP